MDPSMKMERSFFSITPGERLDEVPWRAALLDVVCGLSAFNLSLSEGLSLQTAVTGNTVVLRGGRPFCK
jgi:hypothetical protein